MKLGNHLLKAAMLSTISIASLSVGSAAFAQDNAPQASDEVDEDVIIVTATKREQTLQEVPVAVSVTSAAAIERAQVRDLKDLQTLVPTLRVSQLQSSANTNFIIRGFGNGANNPGIEGSVGVFIDGVYRSRSASAISDLPNLQRVEVLRGPQSTLFGKNASAGVISIVTAAPSYEFGGSAEISYGNRNAIVAKADVTGPISDNIAFSLAGGINKADGYGTNLTDGSKTSERNRWYGRAQLLIEPSESFKLRIIGDYDKIDENCCFVGNIFDGPTGAAIRAIGGKVNSGGIFSYSEYQNFASENKITNGGVSMQADYEMGSLSLTSITAYRKSRAKTNADSDFTSADLIGQNRGDVDISTKTQELRLASDFDGPFNFLLGGYYFDESINKKEALTLGKDFRNYANALTGGSYVGLEPTIRALAGVPASAAPFGGQGQGRFEDWDYKNKAYSVFGTADLELTDGLVLTGGFNYTKDKKDILASDIRVTDVFSAIDLIPVANALGAALPAALPAGFVPAGGTALSAALFPRVNACRIATNAPAATTANPSRSGTCNPALNLQALQFLPPFLNIPNAVEDGRTRDGKLTYSARVAWEATDNINLYASYGTGFKATSWNMSIDSRPFAADFVAATPGQSTTTPASKIRTAGLATANLTSGTRYALPEEATVMELGLKAKWDRVAFNLTIFDQSIKNFQGNSFIGTGFVLSNAGKQSVKGIEFDSSVNPTDALQLRAAFVYLDSKYDSYVGSQFGDVSGQSVAGIPKLSTTLGATYTAELNEGTTLILNADYHNESKVVINENPAWRQYKREVNDLSAAVTLRLDSGLQFSLWGRNLTDAKYLSVIFPSVVQEGSISGYPNTPRTYGASVKYKF
ncbi:MAG: TonB-dependent receptor [Sphingorhabdus sp.]|uniref:TonB-dependent receptor n=1 Tax=Sphingorhabdus sp. TaxID=1902408 RepID=UPI0025F972ED|nr:TonB-dependent receptor [Sphingorhabdus sp.]MCO4092584.1 TonB-dependent receptor [Sphingorhabdus sp.]